MPLTPEEQAAMLSSTPPSLPSRSTGNKQNSPTDLFNAWMRNQPWYQEYFQRLGQDPNHAHLSDKQRKELQGILTQHGYDLSKSDGMNIDPAGNLNDPHGFASQPTWLKAVEIGGAAAAGGVGAGALFGGAGVAGTGASLTGPVSITGSTLGGGGVVAGGAGATGTIAGLAGGGSTLDKIGGLVKKAAPVLRGAGQAIGDVAGAAAADRLKQMNLDLTANEQNISGQSSYESELMNRARQEEAQRGQANKDVYRADFFNNYQASPYDPVQHPTMSPRLTETLNTEAKQGAGKLAASPQYDMSKMTPLPPYTPIVPSKSKLAKPSTLETIGDWLSPGLSATGAIADVL